MLVKATVFFLCLALLSQRGAVGVGSTAWGLTLALTLCLIYQRKRAGTLLPVKEPTRGLLRAIGLCLLCQLPSVVLSYDSLASAGRFATMWLYYLAPVLVGSLAVRDMGKLRWAFAALLLAGLGEGLLVVYRGLALADASIHAVGFKGHHSLLGSLCALLAPLLAVVCLDDGFKKGERLCSFIALVAVLAAAFYSGSRAAWLCLLFTLPLACLPYALQSIKKLFCCLCCALVLVAAFNASAKFGNRFVSITDTEADWSNLTRLHLWHVSLLTAKEHPLGVGLGEYKEVTERYYKAKYSTQRLPLNHPHAHNVYIMTLVESGLLGLAGLLYLYLSVFYRNVRAYLARRSPYALMLATGVLSLLIFGLTDVVNSYSATMKLWWFLAGALTMAQEG